MTTILDYDFTPGFDCTERDLKDLYDPDLKYESEKLEGERFLDVLPKLAE